MKVQFTQEEIEMLHEFAKTIPNLIGTDFTDPFKHSCCHTTDINHCLCCDYRSECKEILEDKDAAEFIKENEELDKLDNAFREEVNRMYFKGRITNDKKILAKYIGCEVKDIREIEYIDYHNTTCVTYSLALKS